MRLVDVQSMMECHYGANCTSAVEAEFDERFCMLFLITYVFLLRLPSEALPIVRGRSGFADYGMKHKAVVSLVDDGLQLRLSHRKNISKECIPKRPCWCKSAHYLVCPVHVIWPYIEGFEEGQSIFGGITPSAARTTLRRYLAWIGKSDAMKFRTHGLRRGRADDLGAS